MFQTSYSSIILETSEENLYLVDIDSEVNYHHLMNVRTDNLPYEYIPVPDKLYDYEPQNSEPEFIKKLESYGQHDGPLKFIGHFVKDYMDDIRKYTLCNSNKSSSFTPS